MGGHEARVSGKRTVSRNQACADLVHAKGLKFFSVDLDGNCHGCKKFASKSRDKGRKPYKVTKVVEEEVEAAAVTTTTTAKPGSGFGGFR